MPAILYYPTISPSRSFSCSASPMDWAFIEIGPLYEKPRGLRSRTPRNGIHE